MTMNLGNPFSVIYHLNSENNLKNFSQLHIYHFNSVNNIRTLFVHNIIVIISVSSARSQKYSSIQCGSCCMLVVPYCTVWSCMQAGYLFLCVVSV